MTDGITPVQPVVAVARLAKFVDVMMPYRLGSGEYALGTFGLLTDTPWSKDKSGVLGSDCLGAICYAYALSRHRKGFNTGNRYGRWDILDVEDDVNSNSIIGDALHAQDLFTIVPQGELIETGDILAYPTIMLTVTTGVAPMLHTDWLRNDDGSIKQWIGHGQLVKSCNGARAGGHYSDAQVLQCYGSNDRRPAIRLTDASAMDHHDHTWPKDEHRTRVLRLHPRYKVH